MQRPSLDDHVTCHAVIAQVMITSPYGAQTSYMPFYCELKNAGTSHMLTFTADDGSGDTEVRCFTITAPRKVETKNKGPVHTLHITTRNMVDISIQFSSAETVKSWVDLLLLVDTHSSKAPLDHSPGTYSCVVFMDVSYITFLTSSQAPSLKIKAQLVLQLLTIIRSASRYLLLGHQHHGHRLNRVK